MIVLDENIPENQRQLLKGWNIKTGQIGCGVGRKGLTDEEIIPTLQKLGNPAFFTRDQGFYNRYLRHKGYCLVVLAVEQYEAAYFIRRFLKHPLFKTRSGRLGMVCRVSQTGVRMWKPDAEREASIGWD